MCSLPLSAVRGRVEAALKGAAFFSDGGNVEWSRKSARGS